MRLTDEHVELAVGKDPERPALRMVRFDRERGTLSATNGHMAAVVPIEEGEYLESDITSNLDVEAILMARKELREEIAAADDAAKNEVGKRGAVINAAPGGVTLTTGRFFPCPDEQLEFPDVDGLRLSNDPRHYDAVVSLNANLLLRLAKAISQKGIVRLFIKNDRAHPIFVEPVPRGDRDHDREVVRVPSGWLMPVGDVEMDKRLGRKTRKAKAEAPADAPAEGAPAA